MYSNYTRFNAKQNKNHSTAQHILHSSWIKLFIFCNLFLLASHVPTMSSALSCHFLFPSDLPVQRQLVFSEDYTTFRQSKQRITDQCTKRAGQWVTQMKTHCNIRSAWGVSHYLPLSADTHVNVGKHGFTCFPEIRFKCGFFSRFSFLWTTISLRTA